MEEKKADEDLTTMDEANKPTISESPSKLSSSFVSYGPNLHVSNHPVLAHKLSILRSSSTSPSSFRSTLREITFHLGYEATSSLSTREIPITVPGTNHTDHIEAIGSKISQKIALIPILRSGLGMVDSMLELVGDARVHHIGMYRSKSLMPVQYYNRLPKKCEVDVAYILDPLIATSATIISVASILKKVSIRAWIIVHCQLLGFTLSVGLFVILSACLSLCLL
jgi:uracil phosphoribosyltransferase